MADDQERSANILVGQLAGQKIGPGLIVLPGQGNSLAIETDAGVVVLDASGYIKPIQAVPAVDESVLEEIVDEIQPSLLGRRVCRLCAKHGRTIIASALDKQSRGSVGASNVHGSIFVSAATPCLVLGEL